MNSPLTFFNHWGMRAQTPQITLFFSPVMKMPEVFLLSHPILFAFWVFLCAKLKTKSSPACAVAVDDVVLCTLADGVWQLVL